MSAGQTGRTVVQANGVVAISDSAEATTSRFATFADGDTTPDVSGSHYFIVNNTTPVTYTDFDGVTEDGYEITLFFMSNEDQIAHSGDIDLPGGMSRMFAAKDVFRLMYKGGVWYGLSEGRFD